MRKSGVTIYEDEQLGLLYVPGPKNGKYACRRFTPSYEDLRGRGYSCVLPGIQCAHFIKDWFRDPRPDPPPPRSRSAIFRELVMSSNFCLDVKMSMISNHLLEDDPGILATDNEIERQYGSFHKFAELPPELQVMILKAFQSSPRLVCVATVTEWPYKCRMSLRMRQPLIATLEEFKMESLRLGREDITTGLGI